MFTFLAALTEVQKFSSHVETLVLSAQFDRLGQSGFYEWLLLLDGMTLAPGHLGQRVQHLGRLVMQTAQQSGLRMVNGKLMGSEGPGRMIGIMESSMGKFSQLFVLTSCRWSFRLHGDLLRRRWLRWDFREQLWCERVKAQAALFIQQRVTTRRRR
jgi:hypothetical protein